MAGKRTHIKSPASSSSENESASKRLRRCGERELNTVNGDLEMASSAPKNVADDEKPSRDEKRSLQLRAVPGKKKLRSSGAHDDDDDEEAAAKFLGGPVPDKEARTLWPHRYDGKKKTPAAGSDRSNEDEETIQARCHYTRALVDKCHIFDLYDDAYVQAEEGLEPYICKIMEMFEGIDGNLYFTAKWFYRANDTVIKNFDYLIDRKRVFISEIQDDNPLDCLVRKLKIAMIPLNADCEAKKAAASDCDYYCDLKYLLPYSTFINIPQESKLAGSEASSTISSDVDVNEVKSDNEEVSQVQRCARSEVTLLDLYSGCGAMSTGLCLGAELAGLRVVTRWAVDLNKYACESLKWNHPETEVRNESAEDFLFLLKEWKKLCVFFGLIKSDDQQEVHQFFDTNDDEDDKEDASDGNNSEDDSETFEVGKILAICYGDPNQIKERGLYLKIRWKNYGPEEDTWEPIQGLGGCQERVKEFVVQGFDARILPMPGDADIICGGPPCQGISGFNRFRNKENPLADEKNKQLLVFMDIVEYLKPRYVLMENVVDILKFANGYLGRYGLGRLIQMNYQTRMGMMAAGSYGLPQFRMRFFLWGAQPNQRLPQFPLPTHDVIVRGVTPLEFEENTISYSEGQKVKLEEKLLLKDAISDLPPVENDEERDEMPYGEKPQTAFQQFIRLRKTEMLGSSTNSKAAKDVLYDHRPLKLNTDDYQRVCQIPKRKGANFRDLPGVRVGADNRVEWDPDVKRIYLNSGKPLVPDYAMSFMDGMSSKPFGRLWWDETVPTVVTRAEPHNQVILHPEQDRVLSVRENARLQGFPDYYKLFGPIKERYIQVGNAVAVPVARALGYALGMAFQGSTADEPLFTLPPGFPNHRERLASDSSEDVS